MEDVFACFFARENIVKTLHTIISTNKTGNSDPIVHILLQLIQLPVTLAFTDVGFTPLRADTTIIIPYEEMSRAQLDAIAEAVRTMQQHGSYSSSVQMGGGLYVRSVRAEKVWHVDPALVVFASNVLIRASIGGKDRRKNVSNVVIQRVLGAVNIRHDKIVEAERLSQEHFAESVVV